jgi:hypothetical protein
MTCDIVLGLQTDRRQTTNHEWYERRGYRLIHKQHNHYWDAHKEAPDMWTVFLRRDIA